MVATQNETISRAAADGFHALPVGLNARRFGIMEPTTVDRAPEIRIELEVGAAPLFAHRAERLLEMLLHLGMSAIQHVPWSVPPSAKSYLAGHQRFIVSAADEPLWMLLENVGTLFGDKRSYPNGRLEAAFSNLFQNSDNVSAKCFARLQPIAHR